MCQCREISCDDSSCILGTLKCHEINMFCFLLVFEGLQLLSQVFSSQRKCAFAMDIVHRRGSSTPVISILGILPKGNLKCYLPSRGGGSRVPLTYSEK